MKHFRFVTLCALLMVIFSSCGFFDEAQQKKDALSEEAKNKIEEMKGEYEETKGKVEEKIDAINEAMDAVDGVFEGDSSEESADPPAENTEN